MSGETSAAVTAAQTLFRVALGGVLVAHGSQKLFGWFGGGGVEGTAKGMHAMGFRPATQNAVLAGLGEAGSGAALALGLGTPLAGAGAATTMGVAASTHVPNGFFASDGGLEYPAVLGLAAAAFAIGGAGPVSLDHLTGHVLDRPWLRVAAVVAVPILVGVTVYRRRRALAEQKAPQQQAAQTAQATDAGEGFGVA